jgi:hypothetical protein
MATLEPYNLAWPTGVDQMLLVSVGTGTTSHAIAALRPKDMNLLYNVESVPNALMYAALNEQDLLCRAFGDCLVGAPLDIELGDMKGAKGPADSKLFTYMRFNVELSEEALGQLGLGGIRPEDVQALDSIDHMSELRQIGQAVAQAQMKAHHFACF